MAERHGEPASVRVEQRRRAGADRESAAQALAVLAGHERALGVTDHSERAVTVRHDVSAAQQAKTSAHELAHVLLHSGGSRPPREVCEVEAESVAYLVCGTNGLSTDAYSLGYVAAWAGGDLDAVRATAQRVTTCAGRILDALDTSGPAA